MVARKIGQIFVDMGFITDDQLQLLIEEQQQQPGILFGKLAEDMALITDEQLAQALGEQMNMKVVSLGDTPIPKELIERLDSIATSILAVERMNLESHRQETRPRKESRYLMGLEVGGGAMHQATRLRHV